MLACFLMKGQKSLLDHLRSTKAVEERHRECRDRAKRRLTVCARSKHPASVESVLSWARELQHKVQYLIVENEIVKPADFGYWRNSEQAEQFRRVFQPVKVTMKYRLPDLENPARQHGLTLGQVAGRNVQVPELAKASLVARAQSYQRQLFLELEKAKELFLP